MRLGRLARAAVTGALVGLVVGLAGELATWTVGRVFPTDVGIVGFATIWAVPSGALLGVLTEWRGRPRGWGRRLLLVAAPGILAGVTSALFQWSAA